MSIASIEPPSWWADEDAIPEWFREAFTTDQLKLPNVVKWQLSIRMLDLSPTEQHVALVLSTYMHVTRLTAKPAIATLARNTGRRRDTTRSALKSLEGRGWLQVARFENEEGIARSVHHYAGRFPDDVKVVREGGDGRVFELRQPFYLGW